jgi:hypothetical protein
MALKTEVIEGKRLRYRPRVTYSWASPYPRTIDIDEVFWEEWFSIRTPQSDPIPIPIQMRFISPKFSAITRDYLKDFESLLRESFLSATSNIDNLCRQYVEKISSIKAVREILVVEAEKVTTLWTIIKAPPFEDSVREPIYTAQLQILRTLKRPIPINFRIFNEAELLSDEKLSNTIPSNATSIWRR